MKNFSVFFIIILYNLISINNSQSLNISVGSCIIQYSNVCAGNFVKFYLTSSKRAIDEPILMDNDKPILPNWTIYTAFKLVIHGYGGLLNGTKGIQRGMLC